jgi:hypothetical protein
VEPLESRERNKRASQNLRVLGAAVLPTLSELQRIAHKLDQIFPLVHFREWSQLTITDDHAAKSISADFHKIHPPFTALPA